MTATLLHDEGARRLGRSSFDRPLVLEAGAGTGKTAVLVARIVHWCLGPGWNRHAELEDGEAIAARVCERVVAITFTDAAAVEMQSRVARALTDLHRGKEPLGLGTDDLEVSGVELERRTRLLLTTIDRLRISTIHSFCASILRENALVLGLHPRFEIDRDRVMLEALVFDHFGRQLPALYGVDADQDAVALAALGYGPPEIARVLQRAAASPRRAALLPSEPYPQAEVAAFCTGFRAEVERVRTTLVAAIECHGAIRNNNNKVMFDLCAGLAQLEEALNGAPDLETLCPLFQQGGVAHGWRSSGSRLAKWAGSVYTGTEADILGEEGCTALTASCVALMPMIRAAAAADPATLPAVCRLVNKILPGVLQEMRRQGLMTFDALLEEARALVEEHPQISKRLRGGMDQLLVDEFQDTDPNQCALLQQLASGDNAPGLFLVGDPKQSIYGWRRADLRAYHDFVQSLIDRGGERHHLDVNFRSVPAILTEVESVIAPVMHESPGMQPAFQALHAAPHNADASGYQHAGREAVEYWISWQRGDPTAPVKTGAETRADRAREIEAAAVAEDLADLHARGALEWHDAAILMRTTGAQEMYLRALRAAGVPYQVEGNRSYYRRREVIDAACLVRTVVDPNDHLALVAFLRSPVVGVPDAAWLPLWRGHLPGLMTKLQGPRDHEILEQIARLAEQVVEELSSADGVPGLERIAGWQHSFVHAVRVVAELRQSFRVDPADRFVRRLRQGLLSEATEAARFPGPHRLANLEGFFRVLLQSLGSADGGPQAVLRALRRAVQEQEDKPDEAPGEESVDAVRVMSVHKAKGLDFAHVYLVGTHSGGRSSGLPEIDFEESDHGLECCILGAATLGYGMVLDYRRQVAECEQVRLLYVALTRPQQRLVITGKQATSPGPPTAAAGNLAGLMQHRLPAALLSWFHEHPDEAVAERDENGVLWRIPLPAADQEGRTDRSHPRLDLARLQHGMSVLAGARVRAAERQQRRFKAVASAAAAHSAAPQPSAADHSETHEAARERRHHTAADPELEWRLHRGDREMSLAVGSLVHLALERIDLDLDLVNALQQAHARLPQWGGALLSASGLAAPRSERAIEAARRLLARIDANGILPELFERRQQVLGREVPMLLPGGAVSGPSGVVIGTLDLLYRDPASGQLVVADYKTDQVEDQADIQRLCAHYEAQGRLYLEAVARAFPDEEPPRFELWFLAAGQITPLRI